MNRSIIMLVVLLSIPFSFAQEQVDENRVYKIDSVVVNKQRFIKAQGFTRDDNGKIIAEVIVTHGSGRKQRKTISDKDGYFSLDSIKAGNRLVRFSKQGYMSLLYKVSPYEINNISLAFDPNGLLAEYDLGYFKDSKLKSTNRVSMITGSTLLKYTGGGKISNILPALLGFRRVGVVILNGMRIVPHANETVEMIINNINPYDIQTITFTPSYSGHAVVFGMGIDASDGFLIIKLKSKQ